MLQIGEAVFARFSDGYYYWATIDAIDEAGIHVIYFDNYRDTLAPDLVISIDAGLQGMRLEANWENRGRYYDCTLDGFEPENGLFKVTYSQDGVQELIPAWQFRFKEPLQPSDSEQQAIGESVHANDYTSDEQNTYVKPENTYQSGICFRILRKIRSSESRLLRAWIISAVVYLFLIIYMLLPAGALSPGISDMDHTLLLRAVIQKQALDNSFII